ncbi:MAG TPA: hypothetical protein VML57_18220 [Burkholderiales bacterium]|nr:hypothetical protein [Burkholderiales bacterium]
MAFAWQSSRSADAGYRARVRIKGFPPQSAAFERLTDARRWAQQTEAAIREGRHFNTVEAKKYTAAELIDRYIRDVIPQKKPNSRGTQKAQLECGRSKERYQADMAAVQK